MAIKKKLYHKRIVVDVLSEYPIPDLISLIDLEFEMESGEYVGTKEVKKDQEVTGRKAAKMVMAMGSDPTFFGMNEFGNVVEDNDAMEVEDELPF
jgi:hypothetical protein